MGTVTDDTGSPIEGATVTAETYSTTTNSMGGYTLNLPAGNYTVIASASGYYDQSVEVEIHEAQTSIVDFSLIPEAPLGITILSPENNRIYKTKIIPFNFISDNPLDTCILSVDNTANQTIDCQNQSVISREYEPIQASAWYHFNGNALDSSGNNNNGVINGAEFTLGKFGSGLYFDGNDYVEVNDSPSLDGFDEITIEVWVKPILGQRGSIVNKYLYDYSIPINERVYELDITADGHVNFALSSNGTSAGTVWLKSANTIPNNTWTHIVATSDGNTMRIYINGEQDPNTAVAPSSIHSSSYNLYIGAWKYSPTDMDDYFVGKIDELRILNRSLSQEQIISDYALGVGEHSITLCGRDTAGNWNSSTVYFTIQLTDKTLNSCDSNGIVKNVFTDEDIYAKGTNFSANSEVDVYIVDNPESRWTDGVNISSFSNVRNITTVSTNENGDFLTLVWSNPEEGEYDIIADANRDGYYNASTDAVDDVSAEPGVTATVTSTQILINDLEFGDVVDNDSTYYYLTSEGTVSISEGENATGIIPFAVIQGGGTVQISLGTNKTLPQNATIYLDDDTVINEDDSSMVIIRGNESNLAEIIGTITITAENIYAFLKTGNEGEFAVDVVLTIS